MKSKKHLSFSSLRKEFTRQINKFPDKRQEGKREYSNQDAIMSGFACMYFQDPSLLQFQIKLQEAKNMNNLRTLFGVRKIPELTQLKGIIDLTDSENFRGVFKQFFYRLQRGKHLENYQIFDGLYLCSIDGSQYYNSKKIKCEKCLTKQHKGGTTSYSHQVLQAAIMHPDKRQVIPIMPEEIRNEDGNTKQDIEINAAKRLVPKIRKDHRQLGIIIVGDDLYSKQPFIELVLTEKMHYILIAKPSDHKTLMRNIESSDKLLKMEKEHKPGVRHIYEWINDVELNGRDDTIRTNYFRFQIVRTDKEGNQKITYRNSWISDIKITEENIGELVRGGRCRWKIENECFNTLKNQGYYMSHNFGHGEKNLCHNFYLLTLLAFFFHQIFELTDRLYQASRVKFGSKRHMWETLRSYIKIIIFDTWEFLLEFALEPDNYNVRCTPP